MPPNRYVPPNPPLPTAVSFYPAMAARTSSDLRPVRPMLSISPVQSWADDQGRGRVDIQYYWPWGTLGVCSTCWRTRSWPGKPVAGFRLDEHALEANICPPPAHRGRAELHSTCSKAALLLVVVLRLIIASEREFADEQVHVGLPTLRPGSTDPGSTPPACLRRRDALRAIDGKPTCTCCLRPTHRAASRSQGWSPRAPPPPRTS